MRFAISAGCLFVGIVCLTPLHAQITVNPTGVNVASQGATTVFLTFGGLGTNFAPAEAFWCGEVVPADPDIGNRCDPGTLFGQLPARFELARRSGTGALTDIMTIPASVTRRAYQAAAGGAGAAFFYVRRFVNGSGGPDVYVAVTCRLTSGGATTPLSLVDVTIVPETDAPVLVLEPGVPAPGWFADIAYTGTGRLVGRWEVVLPGEELPAAEDLLAESALPMELRGKQRRWMQLERFSVFLPPTGRIRLRGPDPERLPREVDGAYLVLLRIEASDDVDSRSNLDAVRAGTGFVASGAVAGFPMPTLRYFVGSAAGAGASEMRKNVELLSPDDSVSVAVAQRWSFLWVRWPRAARYRLEIAGPDGTVLFEAIVDGTRPEYRPPPFLAQRTGGGTLRWRVWALDAAGDELARSAWRVVTIPAP